MISIMKHQRMTAAATILLLAFSVARAQTAREAVAGGTGYASECAVRLNIADLGALKTAIAESQVGRQAGKDPVVSSGVEFVRSGMTFVLTYLSEGEPEAMRAILPRRWELRLLHLPQGSDDMETPAAIGLGYLGDHSEAFGKAWREQFVPLAKAMNEEMQATTEQHEGVTVYQFQKPDEPPFAAALAANRIVLGAVDGVKAFVSQARGQALARPPAANWAVPQALAAVSLDLAPSIRELLAELPADGSDGKGLRLMGIDGVQGIRASVASQAGRFHEQFVLDLGDKRDDGFLGVLRNRKAIKFQAAAMVPQDYTGLLSLSLTDGRHLLQAIRREATRVHGPGAADKFTEGLNGINAMLGLDLENDLLAQLGPEIFFAANLPKKVAWAGDKPDIKFRDTHFLVGIQVADRSAVQVALATGLQAEMLTNLGVTHGVEPYQNVEVHRVGLPGGIGQLVYNFIGDFLVIAREPEDLVKAMKAVEQQSTLAGGALFRRPAPRLSETAVVGLYLSGSPLLKGIVPKLLAQNAPPLRPFIPAIAATLGVSGELRAGLRAGKTGLTLEADTALPLLTTVTTAAGLGRLGKPRVGRRAERANEGMKKVGEALQKYHRRNGGPPRTLQELVPDAIDALPGDPFADYRMFRYGTSADAAGWILASPGPDGDKDIDIATYDAKDWEADQQSDDPDTLERLKQTIYRFRPKRFPDEAPYDDEGDLVRTGRW